MNTTLRNPRRQLDVEERKKLLLAAIGLKQFRGDGQIDWKGIFDAHPDWKAELGYGTKEWNRNNMMARYLMGRLKHQREKPEAAPVATPAQLLDVAGTGFQPVTLPAPQTTSSEQPKPKYSDIIKLIVEQYSDGQGRVTLRLALDDHPEWAEILGVAGRPKQISKVAYHIAQFKKQLHAASTNGGAQAQEEVHAAAESLVFCPRCALNLAMLQRAFNIALKHSPK